MSLVMVSCVKLSYTQNNVRYMPIVFDTLSRTDYITTKKLTAEVTLNYKKGTYATSEYKQGTYGMAVMPTEANVNPIQKLLLALKKVQAVAARDITMEHALYALHQKYPDVDYFMNVHYVRKTDAKKMLLSGKIIKDGPDVITITATGVDLKTDK